jgi:hypothetical protein
MYLILPYNTRHSKRLILVSKLGEHKHGFRLLRELGLFRPQFGYDGIERMPRLYTLGDAEDRRFNKRPRSLPIGFQSCLERVRR